MEARPRNKQSISLAGVKRSSGSKEGKVDGSLIVKALESQAWVSTL